MRSPHSRWWRASRESGRCGRALPRRCALVPLLIERPTGPCAQADCSRVGCEIVVHTGLWMCAWHAVLQCSEPVGDECGLRARDSGTTRVRAPCTRRDGPAGTAPPTQKHVGRPMAKSATRTLHRAQKSKATTGTHSEQVRACAHVRSPYPYGLGVARRSFFRNNIE